MGAAKGSAVQGEAAGEGHSARDLLRWAARGADRAAERQRAEAPDAAHELWRGFLGGRWSLVDRFDSDGRRYLVARCNDARARQPHALTPREGQVVGLVVLGQSNKAVAYTLGVTESAVSTHLSAGMRKLGVCGRCELVALAGALRRTKARCRRTAPELGACRSCPRHPARTG